MIVDFGESKEIVVIILIKFGVETRPVIRYIELVQVIVTQLHLQPIPYLI